MDLINKYEIAELINISNMASLKTLMRNNATFPAPVVPGKNGGGRDRICALYDRAAVLAWYETYRNLPRNARGRCYKPSANPRAVQPSAQPPRADRELARQLLSGAFAPAERKNEYRMRKLAAKHSPRTTSTVRVLGVFDE